MESQNESKQSIICITGDIDYFNTESIECLRSYFSVLHKYNIKGTFFITAKAAEEYPERVEYILKNRHDVEGHGDIHMAFNESVQLQEIRLRNMKKIFSDLFDIDINGFRAPWYKHNKNLFQALSRTDMRFDCSRKRFEIAFKNIPYFRKKYMYSPFYPPLKPFLKFIAKAYNFTHNTDHRYPYFIYPGILEIPTLGISDYSLIGDRNGPKFSPNECNKIASIWIECSTSFIASGGGVLTIQAHPGGVSPLYNEALDLFIRENIKKGSNFLPAEEVCTMFSKKL